MVELWGIEPQSKNLVLTQTSTLLRKLVGFLALKLALVQLSKTLR